jgi:hypothetical protein
MDRTGVAIAALSFLLVAGGTLAQAPAPAKSDPPTAAAPPPIPPEVGDPDLEPQVTIIRRDTEVVEEVRVAGELRYVKVTPRHGRPYFLVPDGNGANFVRRDSFDSTLKVPLWVLFSF